MNRIKHTIISWLLAASINMPMPSQASHTLISPPRFEQRIEILMPEIKAPTNTEWTRPYEFHSRSEGSIAFTHMHVPPTLKQYLPTITIPEHGNYPSVLDSIPDSRFASIVDVEDQEYQVYQRTGNSWSEYAKYPCSTGKNHGPKQRVGDHKTPEGILRISTIQDSHDWVNNGKTYGKWFCRAEETIDGRTYKGIGIHGTNEESALGSPASLGCIRLKNETVESLVHEGVLAPGAYVAVVHGQEAKSQTGTEAQLMTIRLN